MEFRLHLEPVSGQAPVDTRARVPSWLGRELAEQAVDGFPSCPIPEIARLGRTLRQWKDAFLAYFDTDRASKCGTEAINGLIELHRRIARGFRNRNNYRLRMLHRRRTHPRPTAGMKRFPNGLSSLRRVDFGAR